MEGSLGRESGGTVTGSIVEAVSATIRETGRRDRRVSGSVVHHPREDNALEASGGTIRRSEIGGVNHRYPWSGHRGQPRRFGASGIERSPGAKQAFTENGRGAGAHDRVVDGRIGSYVSRVSGAGRRKTVRFQAR